MNELDFLDALTLISFILQIQNQGKLIGIQDVQKEVDRAIEEIHRHLTVQDEKIDLILGELKHETDQKAV